MFPGSANPKLTGSDPDRGEDQRKDTGKRYTESWRKRVVRSTPCKRSTVTEYLRVPCGLWILDSILLRRILTVSLCGWSRVSVQSHLPLSPRGVGPVSFQLRRPSPLLDLGYRVRWRWGYTRADWLVQVEEVTQWTRRRMEVCRL